MKKITASILILLMASAAIGASYKQIQFMDEYGRPRTDVSTVTVLIAGTPTSATIYKDRSQGVAITNPITPSSTNTSLTQYNGMIAFYDPTYSNHDILAQVGGTVIKVFDVGPEDTRIIVPDIARQGALRPKGGYCKFDATPLAVQSDGTAASGSDTEVNILGINGFNFEAINIAAATIINPVQTAVGLDISRDNTDNDGIEITRGILASSPSAFTVGTDGPFYFRCRFAITDVSDTDDCAIGFRKAEAYQAAIDNYDEMAAFNVISGDIYTETILNAAATVSTDTTDNWADAATKTLEVLVDMDGAVTYLIDGASPTTTVAYSFDSGEVVIPFFYFLHAGAADAGVVLIEWDCGLQ